MSATTQSTSNRMIKDRQTFSQQMVAFPWWAVILVGLIVVAFILIFQSETYSEALKFILPGVRVTIQVTIVSYVIALILGLLLGIMRVSKNPILFHASTLYVELMRGFPLLVIVIWIGFVLTPMLRDATGGAVDLSRVQGAVLGLSLGYAAYLAEVYRSGIESIHGGQMEAARSLGMGYFQSMRYVILPQAIRRVVPPLANDFVAMLKDSSLVSVVAVPEILQSARLYVSRTFLALPGYNTAALLYLVLTLIFIMLVRILEKRWRTNG